MGFVNKEEREWLIGQQGAVIWLTGLPCSGKSTIANELERRCARHQRIVYVLDGDKVREGLCAGLGFSPEDRAENIRRIGHIAAMLADLGAWAIVAAVSPYQSGRDEARAAAGDAKFLEVHVNASVNVCEKRDVKGHYAQARADQLADFTGVSAPYEAPASADVVVNTAEEDVESCVSQIFSHLVVE